MGAGSSWRKFTIPSAAGDLLLHRPSHRPCVVRIGRSIGKAGLASGRGTFRRFPQVFHSHGTGAAGIHAKGRTGYHPLFRCPQRCFIVIIAGSNISKGVCCRGVLPIHCTAAPALHKPTHILPLSPAEDSKPGSIALAIVLTAFRQRSSVSGSKTPRMGLVIQRTLTAVFRPPQGMELSVPDTAPKPAQKKAQKKAIVSSSVFLLFHF